jgi:hypothetical protein
MLSASSQIADTDFERKKNHVVEYILKRGGIITKTAFTEGCRIFNSRKEREEIVADLIDAGKVELIADSEPAQKKKLLYRLV